MDNSTTPAALAAHVLRRTGFLAGAQQVADWSDRPTEELIEHQLARPPVPSPEWPAPSDEDWENYERVMPWVLGQMRSPDVGIHERMVFFWHDHFATNLDKVESVGLMAQQHVVLRRHALGDFRELVREVVRGPAMQLYLDGFWSTGEAPNENLARELMELFTLGRGHYTQADVRAGARALSGWYMDDDWRARFDDEAAYQGSVTFLGRSGRLRIDDIVDIVCDQPQCAVHIARLVGTHFLGTEPTERQTTRWADRFRSTGLDIATLVGEVVRDPAFLEHRMNRVRSPIEWVGAALVATDHDPDDIGPWTYEQLGQVPWAPPNVGGWPNHRQWAGADQVLRRVDLATWFAPDDIELDGDDPVRDVLHRCGLHEVSAATVAALDRVAARTSSSPWELNSLLFSLALASPEFALT